MSKKTTIANRWFLKSFSVVLIALLILDVVLYGVFRAYFYGTVEQQLKGELTVISAVLTRSYNTSANTGDEIRNTIENFSKKNSMELMMINSGGKVIITSSGFSPYGEYVMPDYDKALTSQDGIGVYNGVQENGENVMAVTCMLDIDDYRYNAVRVIVSLTGIDAQLGKVMLFTIFVSGCVILLMLFLGLYFIGSIVKPLRQISKNARKIAQGDFSVDIDYKTNDELGELCRVFNYMANELKNSENIKNDFISSVSHELRTPLTAIRGWSETIMSSPEDKKTAAKGMRIISEESGRLAAMVEELLDFSKMQSGRFNLSMEYMDVYAELTDAVIMYSSRATQENKVIIYEEPMDIVTIYGDKNRIRQVFINIIDNAVKYTPPGGSIIVNAKAEKDIIYLIIEDTGCGIAKADLQKVKTKFFKANNTVRGSGIGLAVADEIITAHGGELEIESEEGKYTRVIITLPIAKRDKQEGTEDV